MMSRRQALAILDRTYGKPVAIYENEIFKVFEIKTKFYANKKSIGSGYHLIAINKINPNFNSFHVSSSLPNPTDEDVKDFKKKLWDKMRGVC